MYVKLIYKLLNTLEKNRVHHYQSTYLESLLKTIRSEFVKFCHKLTTLLEGKEISQSKTVMPKSLTYQNYRLLCMHEYNPRPSLELPGGWQGE